MQKILHRTIYTSYLMTWKESNPYLIQFLMTKLTLYWMPSLPRFSRTVTCSSKIDGQEQGQIAWHLFPQSNYWNAWDTNLYLDPELSYSWWEVSLLASKAAGHGMNHAHNLHSWVLRFLNSGKVPLHCYGTFHSSIFQDEDIAQAESLTHWKEYSVCFANIWQTWVQMTTVCKCNVTALSFWLPNCMTIPPQTNCCGILLTLWVL